MPTEAVDIEALNEPEGVTLTKLAKECFWPEIACHGWYFREQIGVPNDKRLSDAPFRDGAIT